MARYKVNHSFRAVHPKSGKNLLFNAGVEYEDIDPVLLKHLPGTFIELSDENRDKAKPVEQATAAPGEKRATKKRATTRKKPAAKKPAAE